MDTISLVQAGFENVVASMGTALTKDQARILKRYTDKVFISYDGDFAGQKASIRGLEILKEEGLDVKVVSLPNGLDPDDVIKKFGRKGYQELLDDAKPLIDFKLDILKRTYDVNTIDGKRKFTTNAIKVISESASPAEQEDLLKTVRDITGTTFEALKRELYAQEKTEQVVKRVDVPEFRESTGDKTLLAARFVLSAYLFNKPCARETDINTLEFENAIHKEIQTYISQKQSKNEMAKFNDLYEILADEHVYELSNIAGLETDESKKYEPEVYFFDCVRTIKVQALNNQINLLSKQFAEQTDVNARKEIATKMSSLLAQKTKLL
jgi:DNA primase